MGLALALILSSLQWKKRSPKAMRRGRKRRRKGDSLEIPLDLQIEILTRLPAKSLMRFKCVSKLWSRLIRSRFFSNLYLLTVASRPPRLHMSLVEHHLECDSVEVCHNPGNSVLISFSSSSSSDSGESFSPDLTMPGMGGRNMAVLRGLILYKVCRRACIYNPASRQSVTLPAVKSNIFAQEDCQKYVYYFLGHDPVVDQYKVVCNISSEDYERITSEYWVLVLEAGGFWKKIEFDHNHVPIREGMCIDGVIYYLAFTVESRYVVVSFDVRSGEFNMIQLGLHEVSKCVGFIEYGGKPTILDHTHLVPMGLVDIRVLEDGGRWSTKSLALQPCQMDLVDNMNITDWKVQGTTQNGEVVLASDPRLSPGYILYYDLLKNDLRKVTFIGETSDLGFSKKSYIDLKLIDKSESIMHLET